MIGALLLILLPAIFWYIDWRETRARTQAEAARSADRQMYAEGIVQLRAQHAADIERLHEVYLKAIERLGNIVNYGTPERAEHVVEDREPGPEERMSRSIDQSTLNNGKERIKALYRELGVVPTDEEIDREARVLIMGGPWTPPDSLKTFFDPLRD